MAVIPLSDNVSAARVQGDRLSYKSIDLLSAPGQALEGLGRTLTIAAEKNQQAASDMEKYNANVALERWSTEQTMAYQNDLSGSAPDGSDFIPKRDKNLLDSYNKIRGTIKDPETLRHADLVFEKYRGNQMVQGFGDVDVKRTFHVKDTTQQAMRSAIDAGSIKTDQDFNNWFTNVVTPRIDQYVSDPKQKDALKEFFGKSLASEFLSANPTYAAPRKQIVVNKYGAEYSDKLRGSIIDGAKELGIDALDFATLISYETSGTFDDWQKGPTTQHGQHRGLIQWGEPQRAQYGVYQGMAVESQVAAAVKYLRDRGVRPGMNRTQVYAAINGGNVNAVNASDAANGGAPGTVAEKVRFQMAGHEAKARALLGGGYVPSRVSYNYTSPQKPTGGMWDYVGPDDWQRELAAAQRQQLAVMEAQRTQLQSSLKDFYSAVRTSGMSDIPEPTIDDFEAAYGEKADAAFEEHMRNKQQALDENTLADQSTGQIMALVEQRKNEVRTGPGAANDAVRLEQLQAQSDKVMTERERSIKAQEASQRELFTQSERKRRDELKDKITNFSDDVMAAVANNGKYTGWQPSMKDFIDVYGETNGQLIYNRTQKTVEAAKDAAGFDKLSIKELQGALTEYRDQLTSGEGAADAQKRYEAISAAAERTIARRDKDIAGYVQENYPEVGKFFESYLTNGDQSSLATGYKLMDDIQEKLGVPPEKRKLLPERVMKAALDTFNDVEKPVQDRMKEITSLVFASGDANHASRIKDQLVEGGMPRGVVSALTAFERNDTGAAERLFDAAMVKKDTSGLVKLSDADRRARDNLLNNELTGGSGRGYVQYSLDAPDAATLEQLKADRDLMEKAIDVRLAKGEGVSAATQGALRDLFGDTMRFTSETPNGSNIDVIVSNSADTSVLTTGFAALVPQVRASLEAMAASNIEKTLGGITDPKAKAGQKLLLEADARIKIENIMSNGYFKSVDEKFAFFNPYTGEYVGPDGMQTVFSEDDVISAAAGADMEAIGASQSFGRFGVFTPKNNYRRP